MIVRYKCKYVSAKLLIIHVYGRESQYIYVWAADKDKVANGTTLILIAKSLSL